MIITGLTGGIGHGKTTFANLLADRAKVAAHFETWELVAEVATALRLEQPAHPSPDDLEAVNGWLHPLADIIQLHAHTTIPFNNIKLTPSRLQQHPEYFEKLFEYLRAVQHDPTLQTVDITNDNKQQFRAFLQWLGGYMVVIGGSGIWYDELVRRIAQLRTSGVDLVTVGGVRYPGDAERLRNAGGVIIQIERPNKPNQDSEDLTERERNLIQADSLIINDGNLEQLASLAAEVYRDLGLRQLKSRYHATA